MARLFNIVCKQVTYMFLYSGLASKSVVVSSANWTYLLERRWAASLQKIFTCIKL